MNRITKLLGAYEAQLTFVWDKGLHGAEKTWFAVYDPVDERRLRAALGEFELATIRAAKKWRHFDVTNSFEKWLSNSENREEYFADPEFLALKYGEFEQHLQEQLRDECALTDENTVFAVSGVGSLYGFARVSQVAGALAEAVRGRLLVFFPGSVEANTYRLLNARDGWNYRAVAIVATR